jgi:hypothetical protein
VEILVHVLIHINFVPLVQGLVRVLLVEKIVPIFVIDFKIGNVELVLDVWVPILYSNILE